MAEMIVSLDGTIRKSRVSHGHVQRMKDFCVPKKSLKHIPKEIIQNQQGYIENHKQRFEEV